MKQVNKFITINDIVDNIREVELPSYVVDVLTSKIKAMIKEDGDKLKLVKLNGTHSSKFTVEAYLTALKYLDCRNDEEVSKRTVSRLLTVVNNINYHGSKHFDSVVKHYIHSLPKEFIVGEVTVQSNVGLFLNCVG